MVAISAKCSTTYLVRLSLVPKLCSKINILIQFVKIFA